MGLTDAVWDLVTKCWAHEREDRPHMGFVVSQLCDYYNFSVNSDGSISTRVQHGTSFGLIGRQGRYLKKAVPRRALHDYQVERKNTAIRWNMPGPSLADRMRALTLAEEANFPAPVATFYEPSGSRGIGLHTCRRRHHSEYKGIDTAFYLKAGISTLYIDWPTYPIWKKEYDATFFDNGVLTLRELAYDISAQMDMFIHLKLTPNELHEGDATAQDSFRWKLGDDDYDIKLSDIYLIAVDYVGSIIRPIFEFRRKARW
ncbi:predicted protein [Postia placenta Mad-698-R]|uniref:Uncharacterized protein n=1 Tax=Postia placenta MAD-698-R-SB12 TaxID=670580 RepID=A0A1X6N2S3_9APHY|nr:hypothetical protein POSPLADRAFT_1046286 [Postia placenta MAD-698-R-SB12]EED81993.1 predicted protein [Postia placenta Mad-698-R]OSX62911.1 hypothetical protein POSPLADRAFT_1046286 [Postia placenta MAD-698-R-SB12]